MANEEKPKNFFTLFFKDKKKVIILIVILVLAASAIAGYFVFGNKENDKNKIINNVNGSKEVLVRRYIDGVYDVKENQNLYPVGLMIENLVTVRPQAGLDKANLVYEALVEGGITRFLAFFSISEPIDAIGPIRSARPYFLDWAKEFDALYGHVGGSPEAMSLISKYDIFNLDQFYDSKYYWREKTKEAPHNVFTASKFLVFALRDKEASSLGKYDPWLFKDDKDLSLRPKDEKNITIDFSSYSYKVEYKYNKEENSYLRFQGGEPHKTTNDKQISAKNVVVQYVKTSLADEGRLRMETIGSGKALIFQDGEVKQATWKKEGRETRTRFYNENNQEIEFNAGQTWVEIVPSDREITYN